MLLFMRITLRIAVPTYRAARRPRGLDRTCALKANRALCRSALVKNFREGHLWLSWTRCAYLHAASCSNNHCQLHRCRYRRFVAVHKFDILLRVLRRSANQTWWGGALLALSSGVGLRRWLDAWRATPCRVVTRHGFQRARPRQGAARV